MRKILRTLPGSWIIILSEDSGSGKRGKQKLGTEGQPQSPKGDGRK